MRDHRSFIATIPGPLVTAGIVATIIGHSADPQTVSLARAERRIVPALTTFNQHIAPLIFAHCTSCHRPDDIGPFNLLTFNDARTRATQIADVTARRVMPPWKPDRSKPGFLGE